MFFGKRDGRLPADETQVKSVHLGIDSGIDHFCGETDFNPL